MSLLTEAKKIINPDFVVGTKRDTFEPSVKCKHRMDTLVDKLKNKDDLTGFDLPYVRIEVDKFLNGNPDPEMEIPANVVIELLEKIRYNTGKPVTVDDKIIIAYLAIYCSI